MKTKMKMISEKLKDFKVDAEPFNLLYLLFKRVNWISLDENGKARKERLYSEILNALLDPSGKGERGLILIKTLLKILGHAREGQNDFTVESERYIEGEGGSKRPIDILLSWKEADDKPHAIIIENKIAGAADQYNQLNDYYGGLKNEGFTIDSILYLPPIEKSDGPRNVKKEVREKIVILNVKENISHWLGESIKRAETDQAKDEKGIQRPEDKAKSATVVAGIKQYREFLECLTINKSKLMTANEIVSGMTLAEVHKLEVLIRSKEWTEAKAERITKKLRNKFGDSLTVTPLWSKKKFFAQCKIGSNPDYWVDIFMDEDDMAYYVCSLKGKPKIHINGDPYSRYSEKDNDYYYYSGTGKNTEVRYNEKESRIEDFIKEVVSTLENIKNAIIT